MDEGYFTTKTISTGKEQKIDLPPPVNNTASDTADLKIFQEEAIRAIAKKKAKLNDSEANHDQEAGNYLKII